MHPDRLARLPAAPRSAEKAPKAPKPPKAPKTANPPQALKKSLFDDSDSDADDGGVQLKVNEEYAKRFEHNKKREERQKLEEKYKGGDDSESDSTSESEDEDAFLATEDLDAHISETLNALKSKDPRIYDKNVKFFPQKDTPEAGPEKKKEKPMFLKDYHRERYLSGKANELPEDDEDADEGAPKTYVQEQADLKKSIVAEIKAAAESDEDEAADFLKPKEKSKKRKADKEDAAASKREITQAEIAKAGDNPEAYLSNFMASRAWAAAPDGSNWQAFESDDGGDSDLEKAEEIEAAYNMRFEDPTKSNEVLKSYARDVAAEKSVRREALTGRKRQRELERERKEEAKRERAEEKARLKKLKLEEASVKLEKIRATAGLSGKSISDEELLQILDGAWEDDKWEEEMKKRFGEDYYAADDGASSSEEEEEEEDGDDEDVDKKKKKKKKPKKPKWDDDIDITDVVGEDYVDDAPAITLSDIEDEVAESDDDEASRPAKKRKSKDHKRERESARRAAKQTRQALDKLVSTKIELESPDILDPANKPEGQPAFRWRETSPRAFGMTSADILLAPSDSALNQFAGIKKYASWRDAESKRRDKKRLGKKARLRQWRRETFGREFENGIVFDAAAADREVDAKVEERGDEELAGEKKKRKRKRGHRKAGAADADGDVEMDAEA